SSSCIRVRIASILTRGEARRRAPSGPAPPAPLSARPRELVPPCRTRSVHRTSSVRAYELAGWGWGGAGAGGTGGTGRTSRTPVTAPARARELVAACPARSVHRTSWARAYELAGWGGGLVGERLGQPVGRGGAGEGGAGAGGTGGTGGTGRPHPSPPSPGP